MLLQDLWKLFRRHRQRVSFYDSDVMREAVKTSGPVNIGWLTDDALHQIVETEPNSLRSEYAHHELEMRAIRRRQASMPDTQYSAH